MGHGVSCFLSAGMLRFLAGSNRAGHFAAPAIHSGCTVWSLICRFTMHAGSLGGEEPCCSAPKYYYVGVIQHWEAGFGYFPCQ
jgi:hypothetical protein